MKAILLLFFLCSATVFGQHNERIKAFKRAHITDALQLDATEAEKFWPIYNAFEDKMGSLRKQERQEIFRAVRDRMDELTNEEASELVEKGIRFKSEELENYKSLVKNLQGVISPVQILKLRKAEEEFKRMLLDRMKNRKRRGN